MQYILKTIFLPIIFAVLSAISSAAVASDLWERGVDIHVDNPSLRAQLKKHAEMLARKNDSCDRIYWVAESAERPGKFYLVCSDYSKLYWTKADMERGTVAKMRKHLSDDAALASCKRKVNSSLAPASVEWHLSESTFIKVPNGRTVVGVEFTAKVNDQESRKRAACLVGIGIAEIRFMTDI